MTRSADDKVRGAGGVLAPHLVTEPFSDPLPDGDVSVKVLAVQDENPEHAAKYSGNYEIQCEYPGGLVASHQVPKADGGEALLGMVRNKLRARHGKPRPDAAEGTHGLAHVAGDLVGSLPNTLPELAGKTLTFQKVG